MTTHLHPMQRLEIWWSHSALLYTHDVRGDQSSLCLSTSKYAGHGDKTLCRSKFTLDGGQLWDSRSSRLITGKTPIKIKIKLPPSLCGNTGLLNLHCRRRLMFRFVLRLLYPRRPMGKRLGELQFWFGCQGEERLPLLILTGIELRSSGL
jgi:hypothetical protein